MIKNKDNKNPAAVQLGSLGGKATAKRGKEFYKRISALGKLAYQKNKRGKIEGVVLESPNETLDEQNPNPIFSIENDSETEKPTE